MTTEPIDRFAAARAVADAVLYEGYVLYPYRASSRKNQTRWQFGVLTPKSFSDTDGSERWSMRTECLFESGPNASLAVRIRCLQTQHRSVESLVSPAGPDASDDEGAGFAPTERLEVDGIVHVDWDEAIDQIVDISPLRLLSSDEVQHEELFGFPERTDVELIRLAEGTVAGRLVRRREPVEGRVRITLGSADDTNTLVKVTVEVENVTEWAGTSARRDDVMGHCLVAVHTMLAVEGGRFVSLLDPPEHAREAVGGCHSDGAFPVLIGGDDVVLSSPIILYDHPEVAPESPGDLYDATEIDEILALRVLTLTDEEKSEARGTDTRAAAIIDRCDDMTPEMWAGLHGAMRSVGPPAEEPAQVPWWDPVAVAAGVPWGDSLTIGGVEVAKGTAVTLRPSHRSDAQDIFLAGLAATVAGVFRDVDGSEHVAVTIDDDPASAELVWQGRYLFFHPDEVEPRTGAVQLRSGGGAAS
jgi:hypothetical protein